MLFWFYAYRSVLARIRPNAMSTLAVCLFVLGGTLGISYYASLRAMLVTVPPENIIVVSKAAALEGDSKLDLDSARKVVLLDGIKKVDGGKPLAVRELVSRVFVSEPFGKFEPANPIRGIDDYSLAVHQIKLVQGSPPADRSFDLIVGRRLAERYPHLKIGHVLQMPGGTSKITGIFTANGGSLEDEVWTPRAALEMHIKLKVTSSVTLVAENVERANALVDTINGNKDLDARAATVADFRADGAGLDTIVRTVLLLLVLLAIVAIFSIATTMSSAVAIRMPELAALTAIGIRRSALGWTILLEGALLGATGAIVGVVASTLAISQLGYISLGANPVEIQLDPMVLLIGFGLGLLAGVAGGFVPSIQVRRVNILTSLR